MSIPTWRLLLIGGAITILAVAAIGSVAAAVAPKPGTAVGAAPDAAPDAEVETEAGATVDELVAGERLGGRAARWLRAGRHLVHAEVTVTGPDDEVLRLWLDHGTVQSIG